ncbi:MAG: 30S ribosomal protein S4e [Candidatus Hydrothermarchaeales archaeon]
MHLKRLAAPKTWKLKRKEKKFVVRPSSGPHGIRDSIPLLLVLRDMLNYAKTAREARRILNERKVMVDGKVRKDYKFPVGLMDVLEIPALKKAWLVLLDNRGKFILQNLPKSKAKQKLYKILDKSVTKGGNIQLNLHDGRNLLVKVKNPSSPTEDTYKTKDTVVVDLYKKNIKEVIPFKKGNLALVTGGTHRGVVAKIEDFKVLRSPQPNIVILSSEGANFETIEDYVFVVGEKKAEIPKVM